MKYRVSKARKDSYHYTVTMYDFYESYEGPESREVFIKVLMDFFDHLMRELIIEKRYVLKMPFGMPNLRIQKKKNKSSLNSHRVDWEATKRLNKKVYHLNQHSNRCYFKFFWDRATGRNNGKGIYKFYANREHKRYLSSYIKKCASDPTVRDYDCLT